MLEGCKHIVWIIDGVTSIACVDLLMSKTKNNEGVKKYYYDSRI